MKEKLNERKKEGYILVAYEKDNDYYQEYSKIYDLEKAKEKARKISKLIKEEKFKNPNNGEPFDWVHIEDSSGNICWASYDIQLNKEDTDGK